MGDAPAPPADKVTLYTRATVITVNTKREIITDGAILVDGSRIVAVDRSSVLLDTTRGRNVNVVDLQGKIVIPGLINTHAHLAQSLLRGLAENLNLHDWLCSAIWPAEACYADNDGYIAAKLTIAEMLLSGTTCFLEAMLTHRAGFDNVVRAVDESGIRACLGKLVKPTETNAATGMTDARDRDAPFMSIEAAVASQARYEGYCDGRLSVWLALGTPRGNDASFHEAAATKARAHGMGITMHCAEAPADLKIYQEHYHCSPMEFCQRNSIAGPKTVLAHMVNLDMDKDISLLAETETTVAHNPSSNCKLGSGIAAVPEMLAHGANVSLGTDGAPCANTYDMIREMDLACKLQAGFRNQAGILTAMTALEMATINAAKALGLQHLVGSLEAGKKADFVVINPNTVGSACATWDADEAADGGMDPVTAIVHSCTGRDVEMVVVDGEVLVRDGKLVREDERSLVQEARKAIRGIRQRSGVRAQPSPWPVVST